MDEFITVSRRKKKHDKKKDQQRSPEEYAAHYLNMVRHYKTEKCKEGYGRSYPFCPQGKQCFYAHSDAELRRDPLKEKGQPRYSRGMCQNKDDCLNGKDCPYAHNDCETMYHPKTYKTKSCKHGATCERGIYCAFKHEDDMLTSDLRAELFLQRDDSASTYSDSNVDGASPTRNHRESFDVPPIQDLEIVDEQQQEQEAEELQKQQQKLMEEEMARQERQKREQEALERARLLEEQQHKEKLLREQQEELKAKEAAAAAPLPPPVVPLQPVTPRQDPGPRSPILSATNSPFFGAMNSSNNSMQNGATSPMQRAIEQQQQQATTPPYGASSPSKQHRLMKDSVTLLGMLSDPRLTLTQEQAEAILDLLSMFPEGRFARDQQGNTCLIHAISNGVHRLIPSFATQQTVNAQNSSGESALSIAINRDDRSILEELIKFGVNLNLGDGALIRAIKRNSMQCAFSLATTWGQLTNFSSVDAKGNSALALSAERGFDQLVRELCVHNMLMNARNVEGATPLFLAAKNGHARVILTLLQNGANPNIPNNANETPLIVSLQSNSIDECADVFLRVNNLDINATDNNGMTALAWAKRNGATNVVHRLYEKGAIDDQPKQPQQMTYAGLAAGNASNSSPLSSLHGTSQQPVSFASLAAGQPYSNNNTQQQQQGQQAQQPQTCLVCMRSRPTTVLFPCNHSVLCDKCANNWFRVSGHRQCPFCSNVVKDVRFSNQQF